MTIKTLLAEDDRGTAAVIERALAGAGFQVTVARDGGEALAQLTRQSYDVLVTDWMMPTMDGIELTRRARTMQPSLLIVMATALSVPSARGHALQAGADDFLSKPIRPQQLVQMLNTLLERNAQPAPKVAAAAVPAAARTPALVPGFNAVAIASSTGGPQALMRLFERWSAASGTAVMIVQHGPAWMLESFVESLQKVSELKVQLAEHDQPITADNIYIAPGDFHMLVTARRTLALDEKPPENFVRPAADPLMRSVAQVFGPRALGVVLTGMGRDGCVGAAAIKAMGGRVVAQDPATAVAQSMPRTVIEAQLADQVVAIDQLGEAVARMLSAATGAPAGVR